MPNLTPFQNAILEPLRKVRALDANFAINFINTKKTGDCQVVVNRPLDAPNPGRANESYGRHGLLKHQTTKQVFLIFEI